MPIPATTPVNAPILTAKDPFDAVDFSYDFFPFIAEDDYISTIDGIIITPLTSPALSAPYTAIASGVGSTLSVVQMNIIGGLTGTTYTVSSQITTYLGDKFSRSFLLPVAQR